MPQYRPDAQTRRNIVITQIDECQVMIYRNDLENLSFVAKNDEDKQIEVTTNNKILSKKIDLLLKELESIDNEVGGDSPIKGSTV